MVNFHVKILKKFLLISKNFNNNILNPTNHKNHKNPGSDNP